MSETSFSQTESEAVDSIIGEYAPSEKTAELDTAVSDILAEYAAPKKKKAAGASVTKPGKRKAGKKKSVPPVKTEEEPPFEPSEPTVITEAEFAEAPEKSFIPPYADLRTEELPTLTGDENMAPPHDFLRFKTMIINRIRKTPQKDLFRLPALIALGLCAVVLALCTTLNFYRIEKDGESAERFSFSRDPQTVLRLAGVEYTDSYVIDKTDLSPRSALIRVYTSFPVTLRHDGTQEELSLPSGSTPEQVLEAFGVTLDEDDLFDMEGLLLQSAELTVKRIEVKTETYEEEIPCPVEDQTDPDSGTEVVTWAGKPGRREVTAVRTYTDGEITDVQELSSTVLSEPTRTLLFSAAPIKGRQEGAGVPTEYTNKFVGEATAYCLQSNTASGLRAQVGYVAVDTSVIPLGTRLYIASMDDKPDYGYCIARDTGGAIVGNIIDLYFYTYEECVQWGRRAIMVYVLPD